MPNSGIVTEPPEGIWLVRLSSGRSYRYADAPPATMICASSAASVATFSAGGRLGFSSRLPTTIAGMPRACRVGEHLLQPGRLRFGWVLVGIGRGQRSARVVDHDHPHRAGGAGAVEGIVGACSGPCGAPVRPGCSPCSRPPAWHLRQTERRSPRRRRRTLQPPPLRCRRPTAPGIPASCRRRRAAARSGRPRRRTRDPRLGSRARRCRAACGDRSAAWRDRRSCRARR